MSQVRIWDLTDPDLPEELHLIRDVFLRQRFGDKPPPKLSGHQQFRQAGEKLKANLGDEHGKKNGREPPAAIGNVNKGKMRL